MQNQENMQVETEDVSAAEILAKLISFLKASKQHLRYLYISLGIALVFGFIMAFGTKAEYQAQIKLLPYKSSSVSGLSGLAGLAGVKLPDGANAPVIPYDLYPSLIETREFRQQIAESPIYFSSIKTKYTALQYFDSIYEPGFASDIYKYTLGLPSLAINGIKSLLKKDMQVSVKDTAQTLPAFETSYLNALNKIGNRTVIDINSKSSIITLVVEMPDPYAAAEMVKIGSEKLMSTVIAYEISKAKEQLAFLDEQYRDAENRFRSAQRSLANFNDRNRSTFSANAQVDAQYYQNEYNLAYQLYNRFANEREQARIRVNQDEPIFTILEDVIVPKQAASPRKSLIFMLSVFFGVVIGYLAIFIKLNFHKWKQKLEVLAS